MRPALIVTVLAVLLAGLLRVAHASPAEELDRARNAFRQGKCVEAKALLSQLLYPEPRLAQPETLAEAHLLYGACLVETGEPARAGREFEEALFVTPDLSVDPLIFSEDVVRTFEATKAQVDARARQEADARALAEERDRLRKFRESLVVYEVRPYYVNFIPFGAGQFQNRQRGKGIFFATTQAATGAASIGIFLYLVNEYGYGGRVPPEEAAGVRRLQQLEIGTGIACLGLMAWGVVDSLIHYDPRAKVEGDDSLLPPELRDVEPAKPARGAKPSAMIVPVDGGAALSLSLEY